MDLDAVWASIDSERSSMADLLEELSAAEWETQSLCAGWRVQEVAAHLTLAQMGLGAALIGAIRAGGSYNRAIRDTAVRAAALPREEYPRRLRAMVGSRRTAPFITPLEPLIDVLVHGQDITLPLGRHRPVPAAAGAAAAQRVWDLGFPFHARRRFAGFRLTATDADWAVGAGRAVEGPIAALLLLLTGRDALLDELSGEGAAELAGV
jgi:uncharacterized protein (TIGR03083 family)